MDLDNIKKVWQKHDISTNIDEEKVQKMIDTRGVNAFEALLRYEKFSFLAIVIGLLFSFLLYYIHICPFGVYLSGVVACIFWQTHKYRTLKTIDISNMNILEVSLRIARYKKNLLIEYLLGAIWLIIFITAFLYYVVIENISRSHPEYTKVNTALVSIAIGIGMILFIASMTYFLYQKLQGNRIKAIEDSLKEIQYFEQSNN